MDTKKTKKLTCGIYFTMAGSWAVGLKKLGFDIKWHYCIEEFHEVFSLNFPEVLMTDELSDIDERLDLIVGSPPCIGMSSANPASGMDHPANQVTLDFAIVVDVLKPKGFIMEMVPMITRPKFESLFNMYKAIIGKSYNYNYEVINFADYGVPHNRKRFIIMGVKKSLGNFEEIVFPKSVKEKTTLKEAFAGLPRLTERQAVEQKLTRKFNPKWKGPYSMYIKKPDHFQLRWDKMTPCVTNIGTQYFRHPDFLNKNKAYHRLITYREAARLMEFPDNFNFIGNYSKKIKQISWGVPCKGTQHFMRAIRKLIK